MQDYEEACTSCELLVPITTLELLRRIRGALFFDRRDRGAHGRALRFAVAGTTLLPGDRLEPTPTFPDTSLIDKLTAADLPINLTFWRVRQIRVKHRNPLFNRQTGITPFLIAPDQLHALNLGTLQKFSQELLWSMMLSSVFGSRRGVEQKTFVEECCILVRAQLTAWEYKFNKAHPTHKPSTIQQITSAHIWGPRTPTPEAQGCRNEVFFLLVREASGDLDVSAQWAIVVGRIAGHVGLAE